LKLRKGLIIGISSLLIIIIVLLSIFKPFQVELFIVLSVVGLLLLLVYTFFGLPRLVVYAIYTAFTSIILYFLPQGYHFSFIIICSLLFILNPLASLEQKLDETLDLDQKNPINFTFSRKYKTFYEYMKKMKAYYYLPQTRKLYTNKIYLRTRQLIMIVLFAIALYLFIFTMDNIASKIRNFDLISLISLYYVLVITMDTYFIIKKGFTLMLRITCLSSFLPVILILSYIDMDIILKIIMISFLVITFIAWICYEVINYFKRVSYQSIYYLDHDKGYEAYPNMLYQNFIYNEDFANLNIFKITKGKQKFNKEFNKILIYSVANFFIITAYSFVGDDVYIYTDFHIKDNLRVTKFKKRLDNIFSNNVSLEIVKDLPRKRYIMDFYGSHEYIVASILENASFVRTLMIDSPLLINFTTWFDNVEDLARLSNSYKFKISYDNSTDKYLAVNFFFEIENNDSKIEQQIRDFLISILYHKGNYVKTDMFYLIKEIPFHI
jgi:hypothetical protein